MLNIETVTNEIIEKAEELGFIVADGTYENEGVAENEGYFWYDEIGKWVQVEEVTNLIG